MDFYEEIMIERAKTPEHEGILNNATIEYTDYNPLCGDEVTVYLEVEGEEIKNAKFQMKGCVISKIGTDTTIQLIKNKNIQTNIEKDEIMKEIGMETIAQSRVKCLMLGAYAIKKGIQKWK